MSPQMLKKINILREEIQYFKVEASNMQLDNEDTQLSNWNSKYIFLTLELSYLLFYLFLSCSMLVKHDVTIRSSINALGVSSFFSYVSAHFTLIDEEKLKVALHWCLCIKHTTTYGGKTTPCSIRLASSYGGSIENESRITTKWHTIGEHR